MNNFKTKQEIVDINLVVPNKWNCNQQNDWMFAKGKQSVEKMGFLVPVLVRDAGNGTYEIIDGEHRWRYCKELEYTQIKIENLGEISEEEAKMLTLMMNNIKGKDDLEKRVEIYKQLEAGQLTLLPFTEEEIENEKALFKFDFSQYDKQEKIEERKVTNTICFALTEEERKLWDRALEEIKLKNSKVTDIQIFLKMLQEYLLITWGIDFDKKE